jgi:hypothetical protein
VFLLLRNDGADECHFCWRVFHLNPLGLRGVLVKKNGQDVLGGNDSDQNIRTLGSIFAAIAIP